MAVSAFPDSRELCQLIWLLLPPSPSSFNGQAVSILNLASHSLPLLTAVRKEAGSDDRRPVRMLAYPVSALPHSPLAAIDCFDLASPLALCNV